MQSSLFLSGLLARSRYDSLPVPTQLFWSRAGILPRMLASIWGYLRRKQLYLCVHCHGQRISNEGNYFMCGISGYLDLDRGVDIGILRRMTDVIRHRGPDDEGYALIGPGGTSFFGGNDTVKGLEVPPLETAVGTASFWDLVIAA